MGIVQAPQVLPGQVGVAGAMKYMVTTDNLSTITTAGYLNNIDLAVFPIAATDVLGVTYSYVASSNSGTFAIFTVTISNGVITLVEWSNPGNVLLPVVAGDIAVFNGTSGQIADTSISSTNPVFLGNVQAGASGTAGKVSSYPATAANGSLVLAGVAAGGNFTTTISNGTMGQSTVYSMGDIGAATGGIPVSTAPFRMKQVAQAAVAGGAAAQTVTDAFCTSAACVVATWNDTTNAVSIQKVVAGNGSFVVTSSGDPGASHINYIIMK